VYAAFIQCSDGKVLPFVKPLYLLCTYFSYILYLMTDSLLLHFVPYDWFQDWRKTYSKNPVLKFLFYATTSLYSCYFPFQ